MDTIDTLTDEAFADAVAGPGLTLIDFWASWCGPCRAMAPQFERAARMRPQYRFAKVDVDAEPALANALGIQSIPTLIVLRDGNDSSPRWPLERVLFALAGTMTLLTAALAALVSPWFLLLTAFVGVNQWLYVLVGACPASIVLRRACHLRSAVYESPEPASPPRKEVTA